MSVFKKDVWEGYPVNFRITSEAAAVGELHLEINGTQLNSTPN